MTLLLPVLVGTLSVLIAFIFLSVFGKKQVECGFEKWKHFRDVATVKAKAKAELDALTTQIRHKHGIGAKEAEIIPLYERTFILSEVIEHPEEFIGREF